MIPPSAEVTSAAWGAIRDAVANGRLKQLPDGIVGALHLPLAAQLAEQVKRQEGPFTVAVSGLPGTGKSTLSTYLNVLLEACFGLRCVQLSIDDLYLSQAERSRLAAEIHPLFAVRGPPGTHHVDVGLQTVSALKSAQTGAWTRLPRFDKAADNPFPKDTWPTFIGQPHVILVDGWFWQIGPAPKESLDPPINERERLEDPEAIWRRAVNRFLGEGYPELFALADYWIHLEAPSWEATVRWRVEQELDLRALMPSENRPTQSPEAHLRSFLDLFQRSARLPLLSSPDLKVSLGDDHSPTEISSPKSQTPENLRSF